MVRISSEEIEPSFAGTGSDEDSEEANGDGYRYAEQCR